MPFAKAEGVLSLREILRLAAKEESLSNHSSLPQTINKSPKVLCSQAPNKRTEHDFSKLTHEVVEVTTHFPVAAAKSELVMPPRGILKTAEQDEATISKPLSPAKTVRFSPIAKVSVVEGYEERECKRVLVVTWHDSSTSNEDVGPKSCRTRPEE